MRRGAPVVLVAVGLLLLGVSYVAYTQRVVGELRRDARGHGEMYAHIYRALNDPRDDQGTAALLALSAQLRELGIPVVVTDPAGRATAWANLPFEPRPGRDPQLAAYIRTLDAQHDPVVAPGVATVHYGDTPMVEGLRVIPLLQGLALVLLLAAGVYAVLTHLRAERERVWAGMARESAHQLGTPLSSLSGWVALLEERAGDEIAELAARHMRTDLERLERVAHRFERIGRRPSRVPVDAGELAGRVAEYFRARVPTLAHPVRVEFSRAPEELTVSGDVILLEWALEALAKNAVDALAGRGGTVAISADRDGDGRVHIRVADDGPGIPRELRKRVFEPGFTTKEGGWGVGLALTRRIVEEAHGGKLVLEPTDRGAAFDVILG
ncbi:MAG TPA: HAMP domain-containing sensor histidine kinase [Gemmatimonadaceae bacterium]|nr:HAMP domain-containing sensor histidine kinase [Gemmatimonadaceae bacterium]